MAALLGRVIRYKVSQPPPNGVLCVSSPGNKECSFFLSQIRINKEVNGPRGNFTIPLPRQRGTRATVPSDLSRISKRVARVLLHYFARCETQRARIIRDTDIFLSAR